MSFTSPVRPPRALMSHSNGRVCALIDPAMLVEIEAEAVVER
jgi:hypothetical protein